MDTEFIEAVNATADTSFDASEAPTSGAITIAKRPSESTRTGFHRPAERAVCLLDGDNNPYPIEHDPAPIYEGPPSGRVPSGEEKRCAWYLQDEYLAGRLGKHEEENGRLWSTVRWIDRHYRIATMPADALPPFNTYVADAIVQDTDAPTGPDDEAPDEKQKNEGFEFERIYVGEAGAKGIKVTDSDGVTHRLEIKVDDHSLTRLVDELEECDKLAKIDVNELARDADPLPERVDFPDPIERQASSKLIRMLMVGMGPLWYPVIRAIADHVTMGSLGKSQGVGDDKAATVGRWRVIEGLRLAESIRRRIARPKEHLAVDEAKRWPGRQARQRDMAILDSFIREILVLTADKLLPANDNDRPDTVALSAA